MGGKKSKPVKESTQSNKGGKEPKSIKTPEYKLLIVGDAGKRTVKKSLRFGNAQIPTGPLKKY